MHQACTGNCGKHAVYTKLGGYMLAHVDVWHCPSPAAGVLRVLVRQLASVLLHVSQLGVSGIAADMSHDWT